MIQVHETSLQGARLFVPDVFEDHRGTFQELYSQRKYEALGLTDEFVQESFSTSARGVLRGLHGDPQMAKLVQCVRGRIWDCIVDLRDTSPTRGKWFGAYLTEANRKQLYVPRGFAHGFLAITDAIVTYKQSSHYDPTTEFCVRWSDPSIGIKWPGNPKFPILSEKDATAPFLGAAKQGEAA